MPTCQTIAPSCWAECPGIHDDKMFSLFIWVPAGREDFKPCSGGVNLQIDRADWFSSSGVLELEAQVEAASPDRELPLHRAETYPQTLACGVPFEDTCLFLTFLVNLPWEDWIPSSWSTVCVQTVWDDAGDINHFNGDKQSLIFKVITAP